MQEQVHALIAYEAAHKEDGAGQSRLIARHENFLAVRTIDNLTFFIQRSNVSAAGTVGPGEVIGYPAFDALTQLAGALVAPEGGMVTNVYPPAAEQREGQGFERYIEHNDLIGCPHGTELLQPGAAAYDGVGGSGGRLVGFVEVLGQLWWRSSGLQCLRSLGLL